MISRIITGFLLLGVGCFFVYYGRWPLFLWVLFFALTCVYEMVHMVRSQGFRLSYWGVVIPVLAVFSVVLFPDLTSYWQHLYVRLFILGLIGFYMCEVVWKKAFGWGNAWTAGLRVFLLVSFTLPFICFIRMEEDGLFLIFFCFLNIWVGDSMALFGGKWIGKHALTSLSPNKTIEGAIIGTLGSMGVSAVLIGFFHPKEWGLYLFLALIVSVLGQFGDLHESFMKRLFKVKDSSRLLPGHGGFYDRADSTLFVMPVVYYLMFT